VLIFTDSSRQDIIGFSRNEYKNIIIDHHRQTSTADDADRVIDRTRSSCSGTVIDLLRSAEKVSDCRAALALFMGILSDTAHFRRGDSETLRKRRNFSVQQA